MKMNWIRYSNHILWGLNAAMLVVAGGTIMGLLMQWPRLNVTVDREPMVKQHVTAVEEFSGTIVKESVDVSAILNGCLFGAHSSVDNASGAVRQNGKSMPLRLCGTIAGQTNQGLAIIEQVTCKHEGVYKVGDWLEDMRINQIQQTRVTLTREDGARITLELSLEDASDASISMPATEDSKFKQEKVRAGHLTVDPDVKVEDRGYRGSV